MVSKHRGGDDLRAGRPDDDRQPGTAVFLAHRSLLFTVAYEMLGSAADAEDVVQETWLRWAGVDQEEVRDARAYLVTITTRQALTRLLTLARRRESYIGPWLPEPLLTGPDVADDVVLADSVSLAMLLVLETLTPLERAVLVLHDVFAVGYDEIADAVDKTVVAVRQIRHRAHAHVAARRPRAPVSPAQGAQAVGAFRHAVDSGDLQGLLDILAPDVALLGDGGGSRPAVARPIMGVARVRRLLPVALRAIAEAGASLDSADVNGLPGLVLRIDGRIDTVVSFGLDGGTITGIYGIRHPAKLTHLNRVVHLRR